MLVWKLPFFSPPYSLIGFIILWPLPSPPHHWLIALSVPHHPAIYRRPIRFLKPGVVMTYTRNFLTCLDTGFIGFPDLLLMWIDKINCYIVYTVMADEGSSPVNCYIVYTVMADDGSSSNSPVQLIQHGHFLWHVHHLPFCFTLGTLLAHTAHFPDISKMSGQQFCLTDCNVWQSV